jgi:glutaminyl-peptide cyclotransferase
MEIRGSLRRAVEEKDVVIPRRHRELMVFGQIVLKRPPRRCLRDDRQATSRFLRICLAFLVVLCATGLLAQTASRTTSRQTPTYSYEVVQSYPHDENAFTQGLVYRDGFLYEGTGLEGRSSLRKVRLETGEVLQRVDLPYEYFGEGVAIVRDQILELTWKSQVGFVYDLRTLRQLRRFSYSGEGWGLTANGGDVYMSDGTADIRMLDAATLREKRRIHVHDGPKPIDQLNELEFVEGQIFANIWQTNRIARISPQTGEVVGWIDLSGLLSPMYQLERGAVLNGIAYDSGRKRLFVTGKLWPRLFEIRLVVKQR